MIRRIVLVTVAAAALAGCATTTAFNASLTAPNNSAVLMLDRGQV